MRGGHSPASSSSAQLRASAQADLMATRAAVAETSTARPCPAGPAAAADAAGAAASLPLRLINGAPAAARGGQPAAGQWRRPTPNTRPMASRRGRGAGRRRPIAAFHVRFPADGAWPATVGRAALRPANRLRGRAQGAGPAAGFRPIRRRCLAPRPRGARLRPGSGDSGPAWAARPRRLPGAPGMFTGDTVATATGASGRGGAGGPLPAAPRASSSALSCWRVRVRGGAARHAGSCSPEGGTRRPLAARGGAAITGP